MNSRRMRATGLAALSGAASPIILLAAWVFVAAVWQSPASRIAAFLDPGSVHRIHASSITAEAGVGILIGLAISLLVARAVRGQRMLACVIFLAAFAAACAVPAVLHEGCLRMPRLLAHPLLLGFVAAAIAGFGLAPPGTRGRKPLSRNRG